MAGKVILIIITIIASIIGVHFDKLPEEEGDKNAKD